MRGMRERGLTLVELVATSAIVLVIAGIAIPLAHTTVKRQKELELRKTLREIRTAIDRFQADTERIPGIKQQLNTVNDGGWPEELEWLYEGFDVGDAAGTKVKYLRRLPRDPMTGKAEWRTRSSRDRPDSQFTDGTNIFDVHSTSDAVGLNGVPYSEW